MGDGATINTAAIQRAVDACSAQGSGVVHFSAGRYLTGTIQLKAGVTLQLDDQAVLLGSTRAEDYRNLDPFTDGSGYPMGYALIVAVDAQHVGIEGSGVIDGQGMDVARAQGNFDARGKALSADKTTYTVRPFLVRWVRCANIVMRGVQLRNSGAWGVHFSQSKNITVENVTIRSAGLRNNDGIDVDSCANVRIKGCDIDSGDDAICLKATSPLPCRDFTAEDCKLKTRCNAIKLGTESLGDFEHIQVSNCQIRDIGMAGVALYCVDGAHMQDIRISNLAIDGVTVPISIRLGARLKTFRAGDGAKPPGLLRDVSIKNLQVTGAQQIGMLINGIPGHPVENVSLENISIELAGGGRTEDAQVQLPENEAAYPEYNMFGKVMPAYGIYARHIRNIQLVNVTMRVAAPDGRPFAQFIDVEGLQPRDFAARPHSF
ncbi:MAG TPA: glycosyl hydrolase family 28 protein [Opitutales bacterium]|nr:glycosyl hydrolase family 28 protein [Opitutales bacterium]